MSAVGPDSDLLYHGTCLPDKILRDGVLERAVLGYECISLTRSLDVAKYFAVMQREEYDETGGVFVFRRSDLIQAGYDLVPFHDPLFGEEARDEQEEQIWDDIPLDTGLLLRVDRFSFNLNVPAPPPMKNFSMPIEGPRL